MHRIPQTGSALFSLSLLAFAVQAAAADPAPQSSSGSWSQSSSVPAAAAPAPAPAPALPSSQPPGYYDDADNPHPGYADQQGGSAAPQPGYYPPPGYSPQPAYYPPPSYPPGTYGPTPYTPPHGPGRGVHLHDGFYLRLSIGGGYMHDGISYDSPEYAGPPSSATIRGGAMQFAVLLGGTPAPGLVIGGGLIATNAPDATFKFGSLSSSSDTTVTFSWFGAFVDWYVNPREGFHLQGLMGFAALSSTNDDPSGIGVGVGIGQEWWVADQWSLGILGRLMYAHMTRSEDDSTTNRHSVIAPALLFTATYH
jgi:hypothetical protein